MSRAMMRTVTISGSRKGAWSVSPRGARWGRCRKERVKAARWLARPVRMTRLRPRLLTTSLRLMSRRPPAIEPRDTRILDSPIRLFLSSPRALVKLTEEGRTPAQKEISRPV